MSEDDDFTYEDAFVAGEMAHDRMKERRQAVLNSDPRPSEGRCASVLHSVASRVVQCENEKGHTGYHESGGYQWPQLPPEQRPNDAPAHDLACDTLHIDSAIGHSTKPCNCGAVPKSIRAKIEEIVNGPEHVGRECRAFRLERLFELEQSVDKVTGKPTASVCDGHEDVGPHSFECVLPRDHVGPHAARLQSASRPSEVTCNEPGCGARMMKRGLDWYECTGCNAFRQPSREEQRPNEVTGIEVLGDTWRDAARWLRSRDGKLGYEPGVLAVAAEALETNAPVNPSLADFPDGPSWFAKTRAIRDKTGHAVWDRATKILDAAAGDMPQPWRNAAIQLIAEQGAADPMSGLVGGTIIPGWDVIQTANGLGDMMWCVQGPLRDTREEARASFNEVRADASTYPTTFTCRLCLDPVHFQIFNATTGEALPGYCARHGADMLSPLLSSVQQTGPKKDL